MSTIESKLGVTFNHREFRRVGVIVNPHSGGRNGEDTLPQRIESVGNYLYDQGFDPVVVYTAGRGDATSFADQFKRDGMDAVISCGGDGTDSEIVQALAGSETALVSLGLGTVNILPYSLGYVERDPLAAVQESVGGTVYQMDLGCVRKDDFSKYYTSVFGGGLDAAISRQVEEQMADLREAGRELPRKRYLFTGTALRELTRHPRHEISLYTEEGDGDRWDDARQLLINNLPYYGGIMDIRKGTSAVDGKLDATVFRAKTRAGLWLQIPKTLLYLHEWPGLRETPTFSSRSYELRVYSQDEFEAHTDAEELPIKMNDGKLIEVFSSPNALLVVAPKIDERTQAGKRQKDLFVRREAA